MSLFSYEALDQRGRRRRGEIEAESERVARQRLKTEKLVVRELKAVEATSRASQKGGEAHLNSNETVLFLQQLSTLTEAGMPLTDTLASVAEGMSRKRARRALYHLRKRILEGGSLAEGLRELQFDAVICNMVEAGEETGQLQAVASRLSSLLEYRQQMRQELLSATLYPAIIMGFGVLVMIFLMAFVVPKMVAVFEHTGGELPAITKMVIAMSDYIRDDGVWLLLLLSLLVLIYRLLMRRPAMQLWRDRWLLRLPLISTLLITIDTGRFARTLGMLLEGGVAVLPAMLIANQSWSLLPLQAMGREARAQLREGESLASALQRSGYLPTMAIQLLRVGEQSGKLETMLLRVANHYEREVSQNLKRVMTIAEPLLVMLMAVGVGTLAMAILLPIVEMNQLVK